MDRYNQDPLKIVGASISIQNIALICPVNDKGMYNCFVQFDCDHPSNYMPEENIHYDSFP